MKLNKLLVGLLVFISLALQPIQVTLAEEEVNIEQGTVDPNEGKTAEQIAEEEKAKLEAEKKESLEIPVDTNGLEGWPQGPEVYAHAAVVMDMGSGAILYAKRPDEQHYPASITKLLTTLVALENAELTDKVTFSQASVDILNWDDAQIGMHPGEEISMEDALHAVLLASANEVSYAVAESTGINRLNGGYDTFITQMNNRAKELGCTGSNWVNPNGLHNDRHYTTAHDMALIASAVYQEEEFRNIMNTLEYRIPPTNLVAEERVFQQNHKMMWEENYYYYEYCTGGKTGYTDQSGTTLVTMADNGTMQLAAVVLYDYGVDAYTDTRAMMDYVFSNFSRIPVVDLEDSKEILGFKDENAYVVLPQGVEFSQLEKEIISEGAGDGKVIYTYKGQIAGSADVRLRKDVERKNSRKTGAEKETEMNTERKDPVKMIVSIASAVIVLVLVLYFWQRRRRQKKRKK